MEARRKYYTFSEALGKILEDPDNLVMTKSKYASTGSVIMEVLPRVDCEYPKKPMLMLATPIGVVEYTPSQEDIHSMSWFILHREYPDKGKDEEVPEDLTEDEFSPADSKALVKELADAVTEMNKLISKLL